MLLPTQDRDTLAVVGRDHRSENGKRELTRFRLSATISTNISAAGDAAMGVADAVGTSDGRIIVWPAPDPS